MAASLPAINTAEIESKHGPHFSGLAQRAVDLEARSKRVGNTIQIANEAQELDTEAKHLQEAFDGETKPIRDSLFKTHRAFTGFCEKMMSGATVTRVIARRLIGSYQMEQQRIADEKRRAAEEEARKAAEVQRQAEADALAAMAADTGDDELLKQAIEIEAAPLVPVAVPEIAPIKVEGSSVSFKLVGTVTDARALLTWLLETNRGDLINELVVWSQSGLNAALKRGLPLPGVDVEKQAIVRNLSR
jgi:hypothetical protein